MRRAPRIVAIRPGILAGANRYKPVAALGISQCMTATREVGIERGIMLIVVVKIAASRVRLPDFNQSVTQRAAVFVHHAAADDDSFTQWLAGMLAREIASLHVAKFSAKHWASDLRKSVWKVDRRPAWSTLGRRNVRRMQVRRLRTGSISSIGLDRSHERALLSHHFHSVRLAASASNAMYESNT